MTLAENLWFSRGERSQAEVARAWAASTGRSVAACQVTLSRYETGEADDPKLSTLRELARVLGVSVSDLVK